MQVKVLLLTVKLLKIKIMFKQTTYVKVKRGDFQTTQVKVLFLLFSSIGKLLYKTFGNSKTIADILKLNDW